MEKLWDQEEAKTKIQGSPTLCLPTAYHKSKDYIRKGQIKHADPSTVDTLWEIRVQPYKLKT